MYTYYFRLYPNKEQKEYFSKCFGCTRFLWNTMLGERIDYYQKNKKSLEKEVSEYKNEYPFLKEIDSLSLAFTKKNLDTAYSRFFKQISKFPVFKSKKRSKSSYTTYNMSGNIRIEFGKIKLPKIGYIKIRQHRSIVSDGKIKSVTIGMSKSGKYFISILVDTSYNFSSNVPKTNNKIGIDLGIKDLYTDSNGNKIPNNKYLKKSLLKLKRLSKDHSRKKQGSSNREKSRIKLAKQYEKITNQRKDYLHKVSKKIINENQVICLETLDVKSMSKTKSKNINRSIQDTGLGIFLDMLKYKASMYGREIRLVSKYYPSSQRCSSCGTINPGMKNLGNRIFSCTCCGTILDRDHNSALNILYECTK